MHIFRQAKYLYTGAIELEGDGAAHPVALIGLLEAPRTPCAVIGAGVETPIA